MKRVYFVDEETRESFLEYDRDQSLTFYIRQTANCVLPSSSKKLLLHFCSFSAFLDTLNNELIPHCLPAITEKPVVLPKITLVEKPLRQWYEISEEEEEETADIMADMPEILPPVMNIELVPLCGRAWEWHNDVIRRKDEILTSYYAYSYMLSWVSFCRLFYMSVIRDKERYGLFNDFAPSDHVYNQTIQNIMCIVVSASPTSEYTVREAFETAGRLVPTMYFRQYTKTMKEYTHIILFRYATFLSKFFIDEEDDVLFDDPSFVVYHDNTVDGEEEEEEEEEDEEDIMTTEAFDEYKNLSVPVHTHHNLKSRYVLEGELLFYSQLMRLNLSSKLQSLPLMDLAYNRHAGNYSEILTRCLNACCEMITSITSNKILRYETGEGFKSNLSFAHLYHGEKERFTRLWPGSSNEPGDVIGRFRPNDNLKISETRRLSIPMLCTMYQTEMQETIIRMKDSEFADETQESRLFPFYYVEYEREIVLLARVSIIEWLNYGALKNVPHIKNAFIIEEMRPLQDIDEILILHKERHHRTGGRVNTPGKVPHVMPYLVKLIQVYYVIDINHYDIRVYSTHFFVEAFVLWLALSSNYKLIPFKLIHEILRPMVTTLKEFLLV